MKLKSLILIVVLFIFASTLLFAKNIHNPKRMENPKSEAGKIKSDKDYPEILWWYDLDAPSFGSAAVDDIDKDGKLEIVFGTYFNDQHIYALNADSGTLLWRYNTGGCNDASPAIADVDLDDTLEVILPASSACRVFCFNGPTGDVEWSTLTSSNCLDSPPAVADVDNDDKPEVILGAWYGYVYCLNGEDGSVCWLKNLGTNSYIQSGPNILDVDLDGQLDVVVAQFAGDCRVYALKGDSGSVLWYSEEPTDYMYHGGSFADVDEDGKPEIAIGCYDNHVYLLNGEDGSLKWDYSSFNYIGAPTSIADLNKDDHLEIIFVSGNRLGVLSHTKNLIWSHSTGGSIFRGAAISDIDGNGILDVAFGCDDGILRVLRGDSGQVVWTYDLEAHYGRAYGMDHAPVIADFDNDGKLDIFIIGGYGTSSEPHLNHGRAYALSAGNGTGPGWPKFRHDLRNSAYFGEPPPVVCGDINGDRQVEITDIVYFINYLLKSGDPPLCPPEPYASCADANGDGEISVADIVYLINYVLKSGSPPIC
jgi:outer membrane protein assembly factor BamB